MPARPDLTVAIPTRGRPEMVGDLVRSLLAMPTGGLDVELVVSDNSRDDRTAQAVAGLERVRYERNARDLGLTGNFQAALTRARGEWLLLLSDDDELEPGAFAAVAPHLPTPGVVIISGQHQFVGDRVEQTSSLHELRREHMGLRGAGRKRGLDLLPTFLVHGCPLVASITFLRRDEAIRQGGWDRDLHLTGDFDLWNRMLSGGDLLLLDELLGKYRIHASNQVGDTSQRRRHRVETTLLTVEALARHAAELDAPDLVRVVDLVQSELPRARLLARAGLQSAVLQARLEDALSDAGIVLAGLGMDVSMTSPRARAVAHAPQRLLAALLAVHDAVRPKRRTYRPVRL